jgi:hypothetical protein
VEKDDEPSCGPGACGGRGRRCHRWGRL